MPLYKRCNFYYEDGKPRRSSDGTFGCKKYSAGHCRFVHPDEDAWARATPSGPPPSSLLHRNEDEDDRPSSPAKRHPHERRRNSLDTPSSDVYRPLPKGPKRRTSTRHESPSPLRRDSMNHSRRSRSPAGSASSRDPGPSRRSTDPHRIPLSNGSSSSRRDEKRPMEPLVPPPPLPPPPSIVTGAIATTDPTPNKEPPAAEKREIWLERIKLLSESSKSRTEHVKLEGQLRATRSLMQSVGFANSSEDDKVLITTRVSELEKQCEEKKQELNTMLVKLMETNYWPVLQAPDMSGAEEKYQGLKKVVTELKDVVTKINGDLQLIVTDRNLNRTSGDQGEQTMDGSHRPAKRRRVDESEEVGVFHDGYTSEEFENIRDNLANLERRLSDVSNDMIQRDADMMDQIVDVVDAKWEDAGPPPSQGGSAVDDLGKVQEVQNNLNTTEADVGVLADEIGKLMIREPELTAQIQQLKEENAKVREDCAAYETRLQQMKEQMERDQKATEALSAALTAHLSHPPSPPTAPTAIPQEYILQVLDEPIQDSVRAHIGQLLSRLRTDIETMMRTKNDELYGALWGKLTLTLKAVDAIARKVNQERGIAVP